MRRILDDVNIIGGLSISGSASISVGIVYNSSTQSTTAFVSDKDYYIGVGDNVNLSNASAFSLVRFGATGTMVMASSDSNYNTFLTQTSNQFF